nr:cupin domain-containing protein [Roseimicrobium gellanilyticum]
MRFLGRMARDTTMYAVDFKDDSPHLWHYHKQDELIVVVKGEIEQAVLLPDGRIQKKKLKAGASVQLPKGTRHSARPEQPGTQVVFTIKGGDGIYRAYDEEGEWVGPGDLREG